MTNYALLNNVEHQDVRIITERSAKYGDRVMSCMVFPFEFRELQTWYPILLQQDGQGDLYPVALFGFTEGENLFLGEDGWRAGYIPAMIRREPFLIGFQDTGGDKTRMLSIDLDHPRVNKVSGEALFQPLGGRTPYLEQAANLLETIYKGYEHARAFMGALRRHELTEQVNVDITLNDGSGNRLVGFHCLTEEKVQALDGDTLDAFSKSGFLMPLFMMLASLGNIRRLIDVRQEA